MYRILNSEYQNLATRGKEQLAALMDMTYVRQYETYRTQTKQSDVYYDINFVFIFQIMNLQIGISNSLYFSPLYK